MWFIINYLLYRHQILIRFIYRYFKTKSQNLIHYPIINDTLQKI
jgi:hypothetical protein